MYTLRHPLKFIIPIPPLYEERGNQSVAKKEKEHPRKLDEVPAGR